MPHVRESVIIHAAPGRVAALYRDYEDWPRLFPATIKGVRLVRSDGSKTEVEVDHREGKVPNIMTVVSPERVDLWEAKRRYAGQFINHFEAAPEGTRYTVDAHIQLKGAAKLLGPFLGPYIRRQIRRYVLMPMRVAADADRGPSPG
jgi:Polyketide cyclase / dehydrase and lipid transport